MVTPNTEWEPAGVYLRVIDPATGAPIRVGDEVRQDYQAAREQVRGLQEQLTREEMARQDAEERTRRAEEELERCGPRGHKRKIYKRLAGRTLRAVGSTRRRRTFSRSPCWSSAARVRLINGLTFPYHVVQTVVMSRTAQPQLSASVAPETLETPSDRVDLVVSTTDLSKRFGTVQALDGASLAVPQGCTGLLGPNGAGKSTLIKLLLGLLTPDRGAARVAGYDAAREPLALRAVVGYMPEHDCLPLDWLAQDFVRYTAELHGLPARVAIGRASDTLYHVGLGEERYRAIGGFSTGMKQRVKLAQALVHDPRVMLLDEPTNGLDPEGRDEMLVLIGRIAHEMGIDVILSSHLLADIERVADTVVILSGGHVVAQGALRELMTTTAAVTVRTQDGTAALATALRGRSYTVREDGRELRVDYDADEVYDAVRDAAVETSSAIVYLKRRVLSLEDIYLTGQEAGPASEQDAGATGAREAAPV